MISFMYTAKLHYSAELLHAFVQLFASLAPNNNILHSLLFVQNGELTCELCYISFLFHDIEREYNIQYHLLMFTFDQAKNDSEASTIAIRVGYIQQPLVLYCFYYR